MADPDEKDFAAFAATSYLIYTVPVLGWVFAGLNFFGASKAKKKAKEKQEYYAEIERQYAEKAEDIQLSQQLAVSRENLLSGMRTESERSLSEVLKDYEFAEPQPTVYQLGPAKEPTFAQKINVFIERLIG